MKWIIAAISAICLTLTPTAAQRVSTSPTYNYLPIPNYTANGGLPHWQACRAQVKAGMGSCMILVAPGESTSVGEDAFFNGTASDAHAGAWPNELAIALGFPNVGINAETQSVMGDQSISPYGTFDTRVTVNGWTPLSAVFALGGNAWVNNDTTALIFNPTDPSFPSAPTIQTDSIDVYWVGGPSDSAKLNITATQNSGTSGTATSSSMTLTFASAPAVNPTTGAAAFIYGAGIPTGTTVSSYNSGTLTMTLSAAASVPAGSTLSFNPSTICSISMTAPATALNKNTCTTPLGPNVYASSSSSATFDSSVIATEHAYNSAQSRVAIFNGAAAGATITEFVSNTGNQYDPIASIAVYEPTLCIGGLLGNDAIAQTPIATFTADLTSFVNGCKAQNADVLLFTGLPFGGNTSPLTVEQYQAAVISVANTANVPVWDSLSTFGATSSSNLVSAWQRPIPGGWNGGAIGGPNDFTHWSVAGYLSFATYISQILQQ
jgi:hypothetical protein